VFIGYNSLYGSTALWTLTPFFSFLILYTVGRTPWMGDQPVARSLPTHRKKQTQNKRIQISMHRMGFEPKTPVFKRAKTVHALDRAGHCDRLLVITGNLSTVDHTPSLLQCSWKHCPATSRYFLPHAQPRVQV
jgi:hypothetical protein